MRMMADKLLALLVIVSLTILVTVIVRVAATKRSTFAGTTMWTHSPRHRQLCRDRLAQNAR